MGNWILYGLFVGTILVSLISYAISYKLISRWTKQNNKKRKLKWIKKNKKKKRPAKKQW